MELNINTKAIDDINQSFEQAAAGFARLHEAVSNDLFSFYQITRMCFVGEAGGVLKGVSVHEAKKMFTNSMETHDWYADACENLGYDVECAFGGQLDNPVFQVGGVYRFKEKAR